MKNSKSLILLILSAAMLFSQLAAAQKKPNIILIMADDLGYGDLGSYGQKLIQTPNIDALAKNGIRFTNYYAGSTVCAPSREALLTGRHTGHTYIRGNFLTDEKEDPAMPAEKLTIAEILKKDGYRTGLIGKWGLGGEGKGPETQGFDYSYGYLDQIQAHNYYPPFLYENGKKILFEGNQQGKEGVYSHDLFIEKTTNFINNTSQDQSFFLYLPYTIPHGKHVIPNNEPYANREWSEQYKNYAAMITKLDFDIGNLMKLLKDKGLDENTIVFFTSDNGANAGFAKFFKSNGVFKGNKTTLYEGGIRVPLIAYWPGKIKGGEESAHIAASWDFLPTICDIAGLPVSDNIDGISFYPTLTGNQKQQVHPFLYWEYYTYNYNWNKPDSKLPRNWLDSRAIRLGKWKAVSKSTPVDREGTIELYDLSVDQGENNNVASDHPDVIKKIKNVFAAASTNDAPFFPYHAKLHTINIRTAKELKDFFRYSPDRSPMVSAHRGGPRAGFPENCIETFENTLAHTPALLEIDPHYTKDGFIVLMHDQTVDRTTNGHGKVADLTLKEIKALKLKDTEGNLTNYQVPTLDEALQWAKGKTILVLDAKDVPIEERVKKIIENKAEANAIVIAYSMEDIKKTYSLSSDIIMEVMMGKLENVAAMDKSGVPWQNVVSFVGHDLSQNTTILNEVHKRGSMAIQGSSRNYDRTFIRGEISATELEKGYTDIITNGADIIEADLGIEAGEALMKLRKGTKTSKFN